MDRRIKVRIQTHRKEREKLKSRIKDRCVYPCSLSDLSKFQIEGKLSIELFKRHISKLLPLVLALVSEGKGIPAIERILGMNERSLECWLHNHPSVAKKVKAAREIRRDSIALKAMLE